MDVPVLLVSLMLIPKGNNINNPSRSISIFMDFIQFHRFSLDFEGLTIIQF